MDAPRLFEKIENTKPLDFGDILSKSIELFKKVWVQGLIHLLLSFAVIIPTIFMIYFLMFFIGFGFVGVSSYYTGIDGYTFADSGFAEALGVLGIVLVSILFLFLLCAAVAINFGIIAHFILVCKQVDHGEQESSDYFMFVKRKYLKKIFVLSLAIFGIAILSYLLCILPVFYVIVPLKLVGVLFAFHPDLSVSDLLKASFKFGNKIWLIAFGLILIAGLIAQAVGFLLCGIGVLFTASFVNIPAYYMYKDGIGFEEKDDLDFDYDWLEEGAS